VRPITEGRVGRASLADIALASVRARLAERGGAVALVGVSPMTELCGAALHREGVPLLVVNRTVARGESLADQLGAELVSLDSFRASPHALSALILATGSANAVFDAQALERIAIRGAPLLVDFGVPSNVHPDDAARAGLVHIGMDAITEMAHADRDGALAELGEARSMIDDALDARRRRQWESVVDPAILELRRRLAARADAEVTRALRHELAGLGPSEQDAVRRLSEVLARQFAHVPSRGLRDLAGQAGPEAAAAFLGTAAPDLAAAVRLRARAQGTSDGERYG
jgi:glutamyl-tRNA reductase